MSQNNQNENNNKAKCQKFFFSNLKKKLKKKKFEKKGSIATLTMNRPDIRNPLGEPEDVVNFEEASNLINNDRDIRCVILTGAGKAFSAGGNVKNMQNKSGNFSGSSVALRERYRFGIHKIILALYSRYYIPSMKTF